MSVERKAYFVCLERIFRQTEKMGMMCIAYGGQPRQEDSISSQTATETGLKGWQMDTDWNGLDEI